MNNDNNEKKLYGTAYPGNIAAAAEIRRYLSDESNIRSYGKIARRLNTLNLPTREGKLWTHKQVARLLRQFGIELVRRPQDWAGVKIRPADAPAPTWKGRKKSTATAENNTERNTK